MLENIKKYLPILSLIPFFIIFFLGIPFGIYHCTEKLHLFYGLSDLFGCFFVGMFYASLPIGLWFAVFTVGGTFFLLKELFFEQEEFKISKIRDNIGNLFGIFAFWGVAYFVLAFSISMYDDYKRAIIDEIINVFN